MKKFLKQIIIFKLTVLSRLYLMHYKPYTIAITGNIGKTSAKDMIYAAVHTAKITRASQKSFNNEFGIPLTILGEKTGDSSMLQWVLVLMRAIIKVIYDPHAPEVLILEVGVDAPGDMDRAMKGITVDIGIITAIPEFPVHAVNFSSASGVFEEKSKLLNSVRTSGVRVTDADSFFTRSLTHTDSSLRSVGYAQHADIHLVSADIAYVDGVPVGTAYTLERKGHSEPEYITQKGTLGAQLGYAIGYALVVADTLNIPFTEAKQNIESAPLPKARMRILEGINDSIIIDDSYNSSPEALKAAIDVLAKITTSGVKIAVLGDMRELGDMSVQAHTTAGEYISDKTDLLITVGKESEVLARAAQNRGLLNIQSFGYNEAQLAGEYLAPLLKPNDIVLVKGSQNYIFLENCIKEIMKDPSSAVSVLVRQ